MPACLGFAPQLRKVEKITDQTAAQKDPRREVQTRQHQGDGQRITHKLKLRHGQTWGRNAPKHWYGMVSKPALLTKGKLWIRKPAEKFGVLRVVPEYRYRQYSAVQNLKFAHRVGNVRNDEMPRGTVDDHERQDERETEG